MDAIACENFNCAVWNSKQLWSELLMTHFKFSIILYMKYFSASLKNSGLASLRCAFRGTKIFSRIQEESNGTNVALPGPVIGFGDIRNNNRILSLQRLVFVRTRRSDSAEGNQVVMPEIQETIELSEIEKSLFADLLDSVQEAGLTTTLRCAGGWVRDKLMGRQSLDIDIALDNMSGKEFADEVNTYLRSHGQETHSVAVIMSNPEQSKHLETARMKIRDIWIDLVNLRSEEYAHNSRIPTMTFGTPEQDAFRRDFTINSLFYNINEGMVEDFTGRGIDDMRKGIIRTPLPAKETFLDDPLRVLRAIRFASRFGFALDESLIDAVSDNQVRDMLGHKVSRERIGTELDGMLNGPDPMMALDLLRAMGLFEAVFEVHPSATEDVTTKFAIQGSVLGKAACKMLMNWGRVFEPMGCKVDLSDSNVKRQTILGALLLPLRCALVPNSKNRLQTMSSHIVRDSLKWKTKDADGIDVLHSAGPDLLHVYQSLITMGSPLTLDGTNASVRVKLGRCLKKLKSLWPSGMFIACLLASAEAAPLGIEEATAENIPWSETWSNLPADLTKSLEEVPDLHVHFEMCKCLVTAVKAFKLDNCWQWKPLLNGKEVMQLAEMERGGPELGVLMEACSDYQLVNPHADKKTCSDWLLEHYKDILLGKSMF
eukprot:jgi/Picsp_1/1979/NSC_05445-R1_polynucleotide adenylyltransferase-like protein